METIRDSAFGKLVRLSTNSRFLQYPEEIDHAACQQCRKAPPQPKDEEAPPSPVESAEEDETWGLYSVMSQASRVTRRNSWLPTLDGSECGIRPGTGLGEGAIVVDWRPNDSENPQNWSTMKKFLVSCEIWLLTFAIYIGSAIYTPGIPGVSEQFGVSNVAAVLGLTLFVLGYGLGMYEYSVLLKLGRVTNYSRPDGLVTLVRTAECWPKPTYVLTLVVFVFFQFAVIYARNFGMLLAFRFLTGFIGSPCLATGAASMGDIWNPQARDYMIGIWGCFAISAPVLGPLIGGFAASAKGWTWTIWPLLWVSGFTLVILFFLLPETYAPNILCRRARRIRRITGNPDYMSESEIELRQLEPKVVLFEALVRPFQLCFLEPVVLLMNLYISLIYGVLYIWFEAFPIVFGEMHGFNPGEVGLAFLGILVSTCCITIPAYFYWKWKYQSKYFDEHWNIKPEYQLPPACVGAFALPISLFWFGWTGNFASVHWIVPIIASMLFAFGGCLIFNSIFTYLAHAYPKYAASALAGNDFMRSSFGAGFPLFATAMFHNLGVGWACTLLGCLSVLFVPYPFVLYIFGRRIRMSSKYARHDI